MESRLVTRASDSPLVHSVSMWTIGDEAKILACPDGFWDLVVYKKDGETVVLLTGQTTQAVNLPFSEGDEILTISFNPSTFLSFLPARNLVDRAELLERRGDWFNLVSDAVEIPTFDNAEDLVRRLEREELLRSDELVASYVSGHPMAASVRSVQRHFLQTTGMSPRDFFLIERAHRAASLLHSGLSASQVAVTAGYSDQAHLCRSLKRFLGLTPVQIQTGS